MLLLEAGRLCDALIAGVTNSSSSSTSKPSPSLGSASTAPAGGTTTSTTTSKKPTATEKAPDISAYRIRRSPASKSPATSTVWETWQFFEALHSKKDEP